MVYFAIPDIIDHWPLTTENDLMQFSVPGVLRNSGIRPNKALGQNFLINDAICRRIAQDAVTDPQAVILEIGAGTGVLTKYLTALARQVIAVEVDSHLCDVLQEQFKDYNNVTVLHQSILDIDFSVICQNYNTEALIVVGNLPYYITGPIIGLLLEYRTWIRHVVIMTQEEVGLRLKAEPVGKIYGGLSVTVQYSYEVQSLYRVTAGNFYPRPSVQSIVLKMTPHPQPPVDVQDEAIFFHLIKAAFKHRRKMLHHAIRSLSEVEPDIVAARSGIDLRRRGETLHLEEFAHLANVLWNLQ